MPNIPWYYRGVVSALVQQSLHRSRFPAVEEVRVETVADPVVEGVNQLVPRLEDILNIVWQFATLPRFYGSDTSA